MRSLSRRRLTVVMTVYNRPFLMLLNTLHALAANDLDGVEILIVDDGSTVDYADVRQATSGLPVRWVRVDTQLERPEAYGIGGHNNPAWANNRALVEAAGDDLLWLSSDTILPPHALASMRKWDLGTHVWTCRVMNMRDGREFLGKSRVYPMCWAIAGSREKMPQFDLEYLKGMAFEDNDFTARLVGATGPLVLDLGVTAFHQTHPDVAYSDNWRGFKASEAYTVRKWGGIPWSAGPRDPVAKKSVRTIADCLVIEADVGVPASVSGEAEALREGVGA